MPEISRFCGIKVSLYFNDHDPAHFHAEYAGKVVKVDIRKATIIQGRFPKDQRKLILGWCVARREELLADWEKVRSGCAPDPIRPL